MVERMVEVFHVADETEEQLSLDAYLETWPHEEFGLPEVQAFKASLLDHADLLAREDGTVLGSGFAALFPGLPESPRVMVTVPLRNRGRGAGTALYSAISDWARLRGLDDPRGGRRRQRSRQPRVRRAARLHRGAAREGRLARPGRDRAATRRAAARRRDRHLGGAARARARHVRGLGRGLARRARLRGRGAPALRGLARTRNARPGRPPRGDLRRGRRRRGGRLREVLALEHLDDERLPRPDRGQARLARTWCGPCAEGGADRLGEGERLRAAADAERRAQRADPPPERRVRLRAGDRPHLPARAARRDRDDRDRAARAGLALAGAGRGDPRRSSRASSAASSSRTTGRTTTTGASSPSGSGRWARSRRASRWLVRAIVLRRERPS